MKPCMMGFLLFVNFLSLISISNYESGAKIANRSDFAQVMSSQNSNPIFSDTFQNPNLNVKLLRVEKMEKPAFESTRAPDNREEGDRERLPGDDIVDVEEDTVEDGDKEDSVKVKHILTLPSLSNLTFLKEPSGQEDSVESDKTITEDEEASGESISPEKDKSSAETELNWDPKYDINILKGGSVACLSLFRGDVGVTQKYWRDSGVMLE